MWGNTISQMGQLPLEMMEQQRRDKLANIQLANQQSEAQLRTMQMQRMQQDISDKQQADLEERAGNAAVRSLLPKYMVVDPDTNTQTLNAEGLYNELQTMPNVTAPFAQAFLERSAKNKKAFADMADADSQHQMKQYDLIASLAKNATSPAEFQQTLQDAAIVNHRLDTGFVQREVDRMNGYLAGSPDDPTAGFKAYQDFTVGRSPTVQKELADLTYKRAQTTKELAEADKAKRGPEASPDQQARARIAELQIKAAAAAAGRGPALTGAEQDELKGKLASYSTPEAVADRQAALFGQQIKMLNDADERRTAEKGREENSKAQKDMLDARSKMQEIRDAVSAAKSGNMLAGSVLPLIATTGISTTGGPQRVYPFEFQQYAGAGDLINRLQAEWSGVTAGQKMTPRMMDDLVAFTDIIDKLAGKKYADTVQGNINLYGPKSAPGGYALGGTTPSKTTAKSDFDQGAARQKYNY